MKDSLGLDYFEGRSWVGPYHRLGIMLYGARVFNLIKILNE
ncbi:hypothetical protein DB42_BN00170 [Neochlamydia sp. EPS4]|nr:hypothetical protein [Neochlamydia sp. EPS4]KIC73954.1 hypothetical protein DB42_BN00170 [Neochlamydia sp. EPS4]